MRVNREIVFDCIEVTQCTLELFRDKNQWITEFVPVIAVNNGTSIDWYVAEDNEQLNGLLINDKRQKVFYIAPYSAVIDHREIK